MADSKISGLPVNSTPALNDYVPVLDTGTTATQKMTIQNLRGGYVMSAICASFSPADATTYYFGANASQAPSTSQGLDYMIFPRAGTVTAIGLWMKVLGTTPTSTTSTIYFRKNATTDTTISTAVALNTLQYLALQESLSVAIAAGDYCQIKWDTPTWATNPTNVIISAFVYVS